MFVPFDVGHAHQGLEGRQRGLPVGLDLEDTEGLDKHFAADDQRPGGGDCFPAGGVPGVVCVEEGDEGAGVGHLGHSEPAKSSKADRANNASWSLLALPPR